MERPQTDAEFTLSAAHRLMNQWGGAAGVQAADQVHARMKAGDQDGAALWGEVVRLITGCRKP